MKPCPNHAVKNLSTLLKSVLLALLFLTLLGCSNGTELNQLQTENEELRTELDATITSLDEAEQKIEELEAEISAAKDELAAIQENQSEPSASVPAEIDVTPPNRTAEELLLGEWFYENFHEEGYFSWVQELVFRANGVGTMNRIYYIPKDEAENMPIKLDDFDVSLEFSWSMNNGEIHLELENGEVGEFEFSPKEQQLLLNGSDKYVREKPSGLEQYVERALYSEDFQAKKEALIRKFLGAWYFDVTIWTFNDDGTGDIDIPKLGDQPAMKRDFSYSVFDDQTDPTYLCLVLDWDDSTSYFYPVFNSDGSMSINNSGNTEVMKLTRTFDIDNCPLTDEIIANGIGVISGSMFSDILGGN